MSDTLEQVGAVTEDMKLPSGSAVLQMIIHKTAEGGTLDTRIVLVGALEVEPNNPAHRLAMILQNRLPELIEEATGITCNAVDAAEIEDRLGERKVGMVAELGMGYGTDPLAERPISAALNSDVNTPESEKPANDTWPMGAVGRSWAKAEELAEHEACRDAKASRKSADYGLPEADGSLD